MSVLDESEAKEVLLFLTKEGPIADSVWGDIYRNRYLLGLRDPP